VSSREALERARAAQPDDWPAPEEWTDFERELGSVGADWRQRRRERLLATVLAEARRLAELPRELRPEWYVWVTEDWPRIKTGHSRELRPRSRSGLSPTGQQRLIDSPTN